MKHADVAAAVQTLVEALAPRTPVTVDAQPRWREINAEAKRRGVEGRWLREQCRVYGVPVRGKKIQLVDVAALDAAFERMPSTDDPKPKTPSRAHAILDRNGL